MPPSVSTSSVAAAIADILAPPFLRSLARLRLAVRRAIGTRPGNTPMRRGTHPTGIEIEAYKPYDPGDELRFLDWNAYARLDQLLVRRFRAEREAPVHVFVDASASMGAPARDEKLAFAVGLAMSLAYVAVRHHDPARLVVLAGGAEGGFTASPVARFPPALLRIADFCRGIRAGGPTTLAAGVDAYLQRERTPGFAILISDFLVDPAEWRTAVDRLAARGFEIAALRPLGSGERDPSSLFRRGRLRDAESGAEKLISLSAANLARYEEALDLHLQDLHRHCAARAAFFAACDTSAGLVHCLFRQLPAMGMLR